MDYKVVIGLKHGKLETVAGDSYSYDQSFCELRNADGGLVLIPTQNVAYIIDGRATVEL